MYNLFFGNPGKPYLHIDTMHAYLIWGVVRRNVRRFQDGNREEDVRASKGEARGIGHRKNSSKPGLRMEKTYA